LHVSYEAERSWRHLILVTPLSTSITEHRENLSWKPWQCIRYACKWGESKIYFSTTTN
jgi:hypothetical protein